MQMITLAALTSLLLNNRFGATFVSFVVRTDPKVRKTGNPFKSIEKRAEVHGFLNFQYEANVLAQLEREGKSPEDFKRGESWHEPVIIDGKLTPLCQHKNNGKQYLRFRLQNVLSSQHYADGKPVAEDMVSPWIIKNENDYENQGTEKPIKILTYKLEGIESMRINGETYEIRG